MIIQVKIIVTSIILAIMSGIGLDLFEDIQWLWEINRVVFLLSITAMVVASIWCVWI